MNEQNIIDALNRVTSEIEKLRSEVINLTKVNKELNNQVQELKEYVSTLD